MTKDSLTLQSRISGAGIAAAAGISRTLAATPRCIRSLLTSPILHCWTPIFLLLLSISADGNAEKAWFNGGEKSASRAAQLMNTGKRYEHGVGAAQNIDRAIQFYCDAAQLGYAEAQYHLGWIYATGRAGKVDEVLGAAWFKAAVEAKHARAGIQIRRLGAQEVALNQEAECVLSAAMIARRMPSARRAGRKGEGKSVVVRGLERSDIKALIRRLAPDYDLDPNLVLAVVEVESNFNPQARSPKNAQGLMQLIPETAARFGVRDVWDPLDNLRGGMSYLRWLLDHFQGDVELALAGYNAGEQAVRKHRGVPPYPETQGYVKRITRMLGDGSATLPTSRLRSIQQHHTDADPLETDTGPVLRSVEKSGNRS